MESLKQRMKNNKKTLLVIIGLIIVFTLIIGVTYAFFQETFTGSKEHSIITEGGLTFTFTESNEVKLDNIVPMSDDEGISNGGVFDFSVSATSKKTNNIKYAIFLTIQDDSTVDGSMIKTKLFDEGGNPLVLTTNISQMLYDDVNGYYLLYYNEFDLTGLEDAETVHNYTLKFWVDENFVEQPIYETDGDKTIAVAGKSKVSFKVNVATVENEFEVPNSTKKLAQLIMDQGVVAEGNGLYMSTETNDGSPTYYYKGAVENNYIQLGDAPLGVCQYNGKGVVDMNTMSFTDKRMCLQSSTDLCDMTAQGLSVYFAGVPASTCTSSDLGGVYVNGVPEWTDQVCSYRGNVINKVTFTATGANVSIIPENECSLVTEMCYSEFGYVTGLDEADCGSPLISLEEPAVFGKPTYPLLWRVMRVNEDNTIRVILNKGFFQTFNPNSNTYEDTYYSNTNVDNGMMKVLNEWYDENVINYNSQIATSTYCEQAKVGYYSGSSTFGNVTMASKDSYVPTFKCEEDANGHGLITDQKIGLISIDEVLHSGCSFSSCNTYLSGDEIRTMSPSSVGHVWKLGSSPTDSWVDEWDYLANPVVSLVSGVRVTGLGTVDSPWIVQK